ncbi:MAG: hypothetical protein WKG03_17710, partial [Telluria sp.]
MPKNPDGGPVGPLDTPADGAADSGQPGVSASERSRAANRGPSEARPQNGGSGRGANFSPSASEVAADARGGRAVGERKKQFVIAPRHH